MAENKFITVLKRIFFLPFWKALLLFLLSGAGLVVCMFNRDSIPGFVEYIMYELSFYALVVLVVANIREVVPWVLKQAMKIPLARMMIVNIRYRQRAFLYMGGLFNVLYVIFYFVVAYIYKSSWFYVIGLYNLSEGFIRGYLSKEDYKIEKISSDNHKIMMEAKAIRSASFMMLFMNIVAATMGLLIVYRNETYSYHFIILYGVGAYVFGRLGTIIVVLLQRKPHNTGIWKVVQLNNLAVVMIMMYTFQTALLYSFEGNLLARARFNVITGTLVFVINLTIVIWLLNYSRRLIKQKHFINTM